MGAPIGEVFVEVGADTSKFVADLNKGVKAGLTQATTQAAAFGSSLKASMESASAALGQFGRSASTTGRKLLTSVTLPVVGIGVAAFKMSADFESAMAKIEGLVGVANDQVVAWGGEVKNLALTYGKSASEAADALYFITSSGVAAADTMSVLEASLKAAAIGLGDTATIANLLTSAMNSYGSAVLPASKATDILIASVREGKLEAADLANSMSRVLPISSEMGVGFDQVGAAFAAMSLNGTDANEAATQIRQILVSLLKPTKEAEDTLTSLGLSASGLRAELKEKGLLATLETLVGAFGNNEEAAAKVFGNVRALTGVMSLMGENTANTARIFDKLTSVTGDTDKAFGVIAKTAQFKLSQAVTDLKVALMSLGDILAPFVAKIGEAVRKFSEWFRELSDGTKKFIATGLGLAAVLGPLLLILGALASSIAVLLTPAILITVGIAALAAGVVFAYNKFQTFRLIVDAVGGALRAVGEITFTVVKFIVGVAVAVARAAAEFVRMASNILIVKVAFIALFAPIVAVAKVLGMAFNAIGDWVGGMNNAQNAMNITSAAAKAHAAQIADLRDTYRAWRAETDAFNVVLSARARVLQLDRRDLDTTAEATKTLTTATTGAKAAVESFGKAVKDGLKGALTEAKTTLEATAQKFEAFAASVSTSLRAAFSFADAFSVVGDAQTAAADAATKATETQAAASAATGEDAIRLQAIADAARVASAIAAANAAEKVAAGFIGGLKTQLKGVTDFTDSVQAALNLGLSEDALQLVLGAGQKAGTAIARELVAGGAAAITGPDGVNALVQSAKTAADAVGANAADRWYKSGVDFAQKIVDGLTAQIETMTPKALAVMDALAAKMKRTVDVELRVTERVTKIVTTITAGIPKAANGMILPGRPGGYNINAGEAGTEAVIPITRPRRALDLMEQSGLANLVRSNSNAMSPALHIENATFATPSDADLVTQQVMAAFRARG